MNCPFLSEAYVKHCASAPSRKMIPIGAGGLAAEKCSSPEYASCAAWQARAPEEDAGAGACPWLRESLMQYCSAAPVAKFVPYSESLLSRCGGPGYRYCQVYASMAHPPSAGDAVDGIPMPRWLRYAANHLWLDVAEDGACHAGVDAFLARVLGQPQSLSYVWLSGRHRPAATISAYGTDLQLVFRNPMQLTACNLWLRADLSRLAADPYRGGWLFEGIAAPDTADALMTGEEARDWMHAEVVRLNDWLTEQKCGAAPQVCGPAPPPAHLPLPGEPDLGGRRGRGRPPHNPVAQPQWSACDGGMFTPGVAGLLEREQVLALFHEFFSPFASGK